MEEFVILSMVFVYVLHNGLELIVLLLIVQIVFQMEPRSVPMDPAYANLIGLVFYAQY